MGLKGKVVTRKELEDMGWHLVPIVVTLEHLVFEQGNKRICWNSETQVVEKEYEIKN